MDKLDATYSSPPLQMLNSSAPWELVAHLHPIHFFVDVLHAEESTYEVEKWHIPIDPIFHAHLQDHHEDNISEFLALFEVILARMRKQ